MTSVIILLVQSEINFELIDNLILYFIYHKLRFIIKLQPNNIPAHCMIMILILQFTTATNILHLVVCY